ncbi:MAG: hypothetical protein VST68_00125 [Nitrospirota bacterium]|nr:hypothetical protein [Nitrospirota bacterium]
MNIPQITKWVCLVIHGTVEKFECSPGSSALIPLRTNWAQRGSGQKGPLLHPPKPKGAKTPFSTGKAPAPLARGSYRPVRERERREERQVCEPEGGKGARTPLADPTPSRGHAFFNPPIH